MENSENKNIVPENIVGSQTDTTSSVSLNSIDDATQKYQSAKQRLLNVSNWHTYAGEGTANFQLTDNNGNAVNRLAEKGDHFRIDLPAPALETGDGDDWAQIESIVEQNDQLYDTEETAIKVRPAINPNNSKQDTAHFFKNDATSTFIVRREGTKVFAEVHGRNEKPNTETEGILDQARNAIVALGAILGFSKIQWKALTKGLLE